MKKGSQIVQNQYSYTVVYEPVAKGYQVTVPLLPGLVSYGRDFAEAKEMATDAIRCYLDGLRKDDIEIPQESSLVQERVTVTL